MFPFGAMVMPAIAAGMGELSDELAAWIVRAIGII
jgi:hypothetical protein